MHERYELLHPLGEGATSAVWCARDRETGEKVALKRLLQGEGWIQARVERELRALTLLGGDGVVRLRDHWIERGKPVLVLDLVEGEPWPGLPTPAPWAALKPRLRALVAVLVRVHSAGVVHRDLKPANVLVDAAGDPWVLDFGLARGASVGATITRGAAVLGTPRYLAPEQAAGLTADARSDLFALGVMLHEALTGAPPQPEGELTKLIEARARKPAPSLAAARPDLPAEATGLVDALLQLRPVDRPVSAAELLAAIDAGRAPDRGRQVPFLGDTAAVDALVHAARAGRSLGVVGSPGSGRSRALAEAGARLGVSPLPPGQRPWTSLAGLLEPGPPDQVEAAARALLAAGRPLLVDVDADPWTRGLLARLCAAGPVLWAGPDGRFKGESVELRPLAEPDLRALFDEPEPILHLPSDGAALLWTRSGGLPLRVVDELCAWEGVGAAAWSGAGLRLSRPALERLRAQRRRAPGPAAPPEAGDLPEAAVDLLEWLALAPEGCRPDELAELTGAPAWEVEVLLEDLRWGGHVRVGAGGRLSAEGPGPRAWPTERRAAAAATLAARLPPGAPGRLELLLELDAPEAAAGEALTLGLSLLGEGRAAEALGMGQLAAELSAEAAAPAGDLMARAALADPTPEALGAARRGLRPLGHPALPTLDLRAEAARRPLQASELEALRPTGDPAVDGVAESLRLRAALDRGPAEAIRALDTLALDDPSPPPELRARRELFRGITHFAACRPDEAAAAHLRAAEAAPSRPLRLTALIQAGRAALEAFDWAAAEAAAREAAAEGAALRTPVQEGHALALLHALAYRRDHADGGDPALLRAAERLGDDELIGLIAFTEAAMRWRRAGDGGPEAEQSAAAFRRLGRPAAALLPEALLRRRPAALARELGPPAARQRLRLQVLALWHHDLDEAAALWAAEVAELRAMVPAASRAARMELLTAEECDGWGRA